MRISQKNCVFCGDEVIGWSPTLLLHCRTAVGGMFSVEVEGENGSVCHECAEKVIRKLITDKPFKIDIDDKRKERKEPKMSQRCEQVEKAYEIMARIRKRPEWISNHAVMEFGDETIGYYDTSEKGDYFDLKWNGVVMTVKNMGFALDFNKDSIWREFNLDDWLCDLKNITNKPPRTISFLGRKYNLVEEEEK